MTTCGRMLAVPAACAICAFLAACAPCAAQLRSVALTFDDLPALGASGAADAERINCAILAALNRHRVPATAFVVEKRVQEIGSTTGRQILRDWVLAGHDLGNHTCSHYDLNDLSVEQFKAEVISGEASFGQVLAEVGKAPLYLRFPYNHTGETSEKRDAVAAFLSKRGYAIAVCTIDNSDYEFARAYDVMLRQKDNRSAARLRTDYVTYTSTETDYYSRLHIQIFGREIPHVMLLHANHLNADLMDEILRIFERKGYRFVTLDVAQSDAAYKTREAVTRFGPMWGYRWAKEKGIKVDGKLEAEPPNWVLQYNAGDKR